MEGSPALISLMEGSPALHYLRVLFTCAIYLQLSTWYIYERLKKEASKVKQKTRQSNTAHPRQSLFLEKMSCLRWDSNPRHSILQTECSRQSALDRALYLTPVRVNRHSTVLTVPNTHTQHMQLHTSRCIYMYMTMRCEIWAQPAELPW